MGEEVVGRSKRPDFQQRLYEFSDALFGVRWVAERILAGQQFNCFDHVSNADDMDDDDCIYSLCIGPVGDIRFICEIEGKDRADLVEAAMKLATEAFRERAVTQTELA